MAVRRPPEYFAGKKIQVGIIGLGYVGLPLALLFEEAGFSVTGFDVDAAKTEVGAPGAGGPEVVRA